MKANKFTVLLVAITVLSFTLASCASTKNANVAEPIANNEVPAAAAVEAPTNTEPTTAVAPAPVETPAQPVAEAVQTEAAPAEVTSKDIAPEQSEVKAEAAAVAEVVPTNDVPAYQYTYASISSTSEAGKDTITVELAFDPNVEPVKVSIDANVADGTVILLPDESNPIAKAVVNIADMGYGLVFKSINIYTMNDELVARTVLTSGSSMYSSDYYYHYGF